MLTQADLDVLSLGERRFPSPLQLSTVRDDQIADYVPDRARVTLTVETTLDADVAPPLLFEKAGPRQEIFFDPRSTRAAIVTCGGSARGSTT